MGGQRLGRNGATSPGSSGGYEECPKIDTENAGQIIRRTEVSIAEAEAEGEEPRGGEQRKKMLKTKIDPTMCMKTKRRMTICPKQMATFLYK